MMLAPDRAYRATSLAPVESTTLPPGVVGRLQGIALTYDVLDDKGTTFARGALARTMRERVATGKVKLYWNHGDAHVTGSYDTDLHIGIVRRMWDEQRGGAWVAMMEADIFDTEEGRRAHEYLRAVYAAGAETGLSIGMIPGTLKGDSRYKLDGIDCARITECGLREISVVSEQSVPGTAVTHVRAETAPDITDDIDYGPLLRTIAAHVGADAFRAMTGAVLGDATDQSDSDAASDCNADADSDAAPVDSPAEEAPAATLYASMDERLKVYRRLYTELH